MDFTGMHAAVELHSFQHRVREKIVPLIDVRRAAGSNHFTWIFFIHDRWTGGLPWSAVPVTII